MHRSSHIVQCSPAQVAYSALGEGIAWAVLDTGIASDHPHFAAPTEDAHPGTLAAVWDCAQRGVPLRMDLDTEGKKQPTRDRSGHGTHVAGIIAGQGQGRDERGKPARFCGMAPTARLHIYRVLDNDGNGHDSWIIKALDHIAQTNQQAGRLVIHGVNLSLGGTFDATVYGCGHSPICRELRRLWQQGVVVCVAAGNEGRVEIAALSGRRTTLNPSLSIGDPANLEEAIAVGSVHRDNPHRYGPSYFSSRGPTADGRHKPDVVAPGERILSCNAAHVLAPDIEPAYIAQSGTSMACPHVSGLIAAFLSVRREFIGYPDRVKAILMDHCIDIGRTREMQGRGIPNLVRMLAGT